MPKDATKNVDRYKIRGGQLNEFDFTKNQEQFAEQGTEKATKGPKAKKSGKGAKGAGAKKRGKK
ncbi:MAG TPA: hypothetical protein VFR78_20125 [Pyrinomonadaceae bacterium]|nr:hypothetical protein [Pyrinomonadaceae bacterium]